MSDTNFWLATTGGFFALILLMLWALVWKGIALWKAARRSDKTWFVILLILNTLGILEIIYIFLVSKNKEEKL
ncbi:hypothetical protein A2V71_03375 [Candidatus Berkelbacteria bacterium RBG_13_40_8]|uniref:DUF5652 domain-containing protein n=1 Tax=Candidatus Berkelbacteria bacterium RBG_13_40_8 TaxID=1797467 RepID=A0A1F5DQJ1_9BACT|nr:MAG: hypothetical protein A2V71_03375 [Candidatus Berkelbacteria bacterium RBG_13_40_8]